MSIVDIWRDGKRHSKHEDSPNWRLRCDDCGKFLSLNDAQAHTDTLPDGDEGEPYHICSKCKAKEED
jgi:hypothetical protein